MDEPLRALARQAFPGVDLDLDSFRRLVSSFQRMDEPLRALARQAFPGVDLDLDSFRRLVSSFQRLGEPEEMRRTKRVRDALEDEYCNRALAGDREALARLRAAWLLSHELPPFPGEEPDPEQRASARMSGGGTIPPFATKRPYWHRQTVPTSADEQRLTFFGLEIPSCTIDACYHLPPGYQFLAFEIGILCDKGCDPGDFDRFWNEGVLRLFFSQVPRYEWPVRTLLPDHPAAIPTSELELWDFLLPLRFGRALSVSGEPLKILGLEQMDVRLTCPGARTDTLRPMVILYGIQARASI